jgi:hypothetical protein
MRYSGAEGKLIHEKTRSKKFRDTVSLRNVKLFHMYFFVYRRGTNCRLPESSFWRKVRDGCYFGTELEDEFS